MATTRGAPVFGSRRDWRLPVCGLLVAGVIGASRLAPHIATLRRVASPAGVAAYRASYPAAESNLNIDLRDASPLKYGALWLYSTVSNTIGPLPFQVRTMAMAAFMLEGLALCLVAWSIWRRRGHLDGRGRLILCVAGSWFAVIGLFNDNLGTAARLRVPAWVLLMSLAQALRWTDRRRGQGGTR